ncbi:MAG: DUF3365 domain-containing protein [Nitrospira sp.]|nr:DUF3365 domain-containing protein [Nitrospira sp.]HBP88320.1 hypothetical protein [Nitrospiraceae bacterium]HNP27508.1 DUF3365 domain-containing protein [Nitrospirales bacterium]
MKRWAAISMMFGVTVLGLMLVLPVGQAADMTKEKAAEMVLAAVKAARTVYVKGVVGDAVKGGMKPTEDWVKDDHGIMLPAQFVKEVGKELREFEISLVGTDPLYASNAAKSPKEKEMLAELAKGPAKVITGTDGGKTIGMSADYAIVESCADCHNMHPKTTKKDWKKGDFMGAIVVRMN